MPATFKARGSSPRRIWWVAAGKNLEEKRLCMEEVNLWFSPESVYDIHKISYTRDTRVFMYVYIYN